MTSLQLPPNQSYFEPGLLYLTEEGMWIKYDNTEEEELLCDSDGYVCDVWDNKQDSFIRNVFYELKQLEY